MLLSEEEDKLVEVLAQIYCNIPWGKMRTNKYPQDIFNHRVRAASRRGSIYEFVSSLCNYFSLQTIPNSLQKVIDDLRENQDRILNELSKSHIPYCVRAYIRGKEIREERKRKNKEKRDEEKKKL